MENLKIKGYLVRRSKDDPSILDEGPAKILPSKKEYAQLMYNKLKSYNGEELDITFTDGQDWTLKMNNLFHELIRKIKIAGVANYWEKMKRAPESYEEVKTWVKVTLCGAKLEQVGEMVWVESWKNFSKKRALQAIDNVLQYCMDVGVDIDSDRLEYNDLRGGKE